MLYGSKGGMRAGIMKWYCPLIAGRRRLQGQRWRGRGSC